MCMSINEAKKYLKKRVALTFTSVAGDKPWNYFQTGYFIYDNFMPLPGQMRASQK